MWPLCSTQTTSYGELHNNLWESLPQGYRYSQSTCHLQLPRENKISVFVAQLVPHEPKNLLGSDGDVGRFYGKIHIPWKNGGSSPVTRDGPTKHSDHDGGKLEVAGTGEQPSTREHSPFLPSLSMSKASGPWVWMQHLNSSTGVTCPWIWFTPPTATTGHHVIHQGTPKNIKGSLIRLSPVQPPQRPISE